MGEAKQMEIQDDGSTVERHPKPEPARNRVTARILDRGDQPWSRRAFEALRLGHLYREEGDPEPIPSWVIGPVIGLQATGRVNMLSVELVAYSVDTGASQRNPAVWVLEHREQYVRGIQHGFVVMDDEGEQE